MKEDASSATVKRRSESFSEGMGGLRYQFGIPLRMDSNDILVFSLLVHLNLIANSWLCNLL